MSVLPVPRGGSLGKGLQQASLRALRRTLTSLSGEMFSTEQGSHLESRARGRRPLKEQGAQTSKPAVTRDPEVLAAFLSDSWYGLSPTLPSAAGITQ